MSSIQLVNAYWASDNIVAVSRTPQGKRIAKSYPAEYSCFLKAEQVTQDVASQLKRWPRIKAWKPEGNWIRVIWRTRDDLKAATSKQKYQNQQYGGTESVFERLGIEVFEADVHPVRRFLTDYNCILQRPRRCYIDIEGDSRVPFSRKEESRILSWAVTDDTGEWRGDVLAEDTDEAEHRLLQELWSVLDEYDQVCAWSGDRYDFPVIKARARLHGMTIASGGWLWVDHLEVFKSMNLQVSESGDEKQSFSLGRISTIILGETKDDLDASKTWEYWVAGGAEREKLFTYNVRDAELLRMLEAKTGYLDLLFAIAEVCHTLPDTRGHNGTNIVEGYLLKMAKTEDLHFRTCWDTFVGEKFEGAFVMEPTRKGILHNVHVCDFSGMYPSIIQTWNISPETVRRDVILREDPAARPAYLSHLPLKEFPLPDDCCSVPGGSIFSRQPRGLIPRAIAELKAKRKYWNELKSKCAPGTPEWHDADRKSNAYKVAANKFFGVLGATTSRFYDKDVASSVTAGGRWLIRETIKAAEARGMSGIYGDSITGDRPVVVRSPDGRTCIEPISDLFDRFDDEIRTVGKKEYVDLPAGWMALARGRLGDGWYPLESIMRHATKKDIIRISMKDGQTDCTSDHSLMVGGRRVTPDEFLANGLRFDVVEAMPENPGVVLIDLWSVLKDVRVTRIYKGRFRTTRLRVSEDNEWIEVSGWTGVGGKIRRYYSVGTERLRALLRVIGAYVSEGSASIPGVTTRTRWMFRICQMRKRWLSELCADVRLFTEGVSISEPKWSSSGVYYSQAGSILLALVMYGLCGVRSVGKKLPAFVYDLPQHDVWTLLAKYMEGDGSVDECNGWASVCTTISPTLAAGISYLYSRMGIDHAFRWRPEKAAMAIRTRNTNPRVVRKVVVERRKSDDYVYDLTVGSAHTFVDGVGRVLLHNTDSCFIADVTESEFRNFTNWCNSEFYPKLLKELNCPDNQISIAYEKEFSTIVLIGKKRYAGKFAHYKGTRATEDSKPEIKGLEYKRGDSVKLARELQYEIVMLLMQDCEDPEEFKCRIVDWQSMVLENHLPVDEFVLSKTLSKDPRAYAKKFKNYGEPAAQPVHVTVANILAARGFDASEGVRIEYIVVDGRSPLKAIPRMDYTDGCEDRYYLWENLVWPPTERVLKAAFPAVPWDKLYGSVRPKAVRQPRAATTKPKSKTPEGQGSLF